MLCDRESLLLFGSVLRTKGGSGTYRGPSPLYKTGLLTEAQVSGTGLAKSSSNTATTK